LRKRDGTKEPGIPESVDIGPPSGSVPTGSRFQD
jgi:hypothetical protein